MNLKQRLELYERLYTQEVERREKIQARLSLPLAILLALLGLVSYLIQNLPTMYGITTYLFWLFFTIALLAITTSLYFFYVCLHRFKDSLVPSPNGMEDHYQTLKAHYASYANSKKHVDKEFCRFLLERYKKAGTINAENNDQRSEYLYRATLSITIAILFTLVSLAPFYLASSVTAIKQSGETQCQRKTSHHHRHQAQIPVMSEVMFHYQSHRICHHRHHHLKDSTVGPCKLNGSD